MLWLKRNIRFNELYKCMISNELIGPGEYYYEDDGDGLIVKATIYRKMLNQKIRDEWDYSKLEGHLSRQEYANYLREAERQFLSATLFDRKIAGKGDFK